ncbi:MAG: hypothetical protein NTX15_05690 [Candidatus Kapabacteria bacterium]|nr:hypothetical protein [Candidatus Kapabacteria bacterium]
MKIIYRVALLIVLSSFIAIPHLYAHSAGMTGVYAVGCGNCHGGQTAATAVTLEGPRTIRTGQTGNYTFVVGHANVNNQNAGFNLSIRQGAGVAGTLNAGVGSQNIGGELTHTAPLAMGAGGARFAFTWSAPAAHGVYAFNGAGNAVNLDLISSDLDDWNLTGNINITVTGATFTGPAAGTTVCRGTPVTYTWTQTGLTTVRLEWSKDNFATTEVLATSVDASTLTLSYNIPASQEPGTYFVRMIDLASSTEVGRATNPVSVSGSPVIALQPVNTLVCEGKPLNLTVSATGTNLQYRWRRGGVDLPGGVNPVLVINTVGQAEAGTYDCVIFGCGGNVTSSPAVVTVGSKPRVTTQPFPRSVCESDSVSFSIDATGNDISFQWLKNGEQIPGKVSKKISFANVTLFDEGDYSCLVQGACTPEAVSIVAKLNVIERPLIRVQPVDKSLKSGDTLALNFDASGELLAYQWFKNGVVIPDGTQRVYRKFPAARADSGVYSCRVSNQCDTIVTRNATVKVTANAGPGQLELTSTGLLLKAVPSCSSVDTTIAGMLVNEGGSSITITSISAEPVANISVIGLSAPLVLAPNERRDVRMKITPKKSGPFTASVTFFASSGNRVFTVTGNAATGLSFERDTLVFPQGVLGDRKCNVSIPLPCPASEVRRIKLTGLGATTWKNTSTLTLPFQIADSKTIDLCFETTEETGEDALVTVETDAGDATFVLTRRIISGIDDDESPASKIRIAPNPMTDELRITSPFLGEMSVRIVSITGDATSMVARWRPDCTFS